MTPEELQGLVDQLVGDTPRSAAMTHGCQAKRQPRGPNAFKQHDVTRAIRAAKAAGVDVAGVEIDKDGKIHVIVGKPRNAPTEANALDQWMAAHAGKA
jgi:hypothetical protein